MATNYPVSKQDLDATRGTTGQPMNAPNHITHHTLEDDTVEALQTKVGIDSSTDSASLDYKVNSASSANPGHKHTLADSATDVSATNTELNYVSGVTSAVQTQLNAKQDKLSEGAFANGDKTKLDNIETAADVTDATNVAAAGAVLNTGNETVAGVKTFSSSPVVPTPTTDMQASTKKYVDDSAGGAPEGTAVLSTGETGGSKFLREDGDGTSSWQTPSGSGDMLASTYDSASVSEQLAGLTATQTLTNKTISGDSNTISEVPSTGIEIASLSLTPERTLQDFLNKKMSSGFCSGGDFTSNGDGTVSVALGCGAIRATNTLGVEMLAFDWSANTSVSLTDNTTNYIYVDYNSGSPIVASAVSQPTDYRTKVLLGKIYREGSVLHLFKAGMKVSEVANNLIARLVQQEGEASRTSGAVTSETGTRNVKVTAGVVWGGLTRNTTPELDTNVTGTFKYFYYNGSAWVESDATQINNTQYNNTASGLSSLSSNQYGIHWVYVGSDGCVHVVYGDDSFTLADAEAEQPPTLLPNIISEFTFLSAKIIVKLNDTNFTEVQSAFDISFSSGASALHNELGGLDGGTANEYYHLTNTQHSIATQASSTSLAGYLTSTDWNTFNGKAPALGSDDNYVTDAEKVVIGNTSNTNTGDESSATATAEGIVELATPAEVYTGTDTDRAVTAEGVKKGTIHTMQVVLCASDTDLEAGTTLQGDFRISDARAVTIKRVSAYVDTAGVTGDTTIDINDNGTSILSTKITINTTEKSSYDASTQPVISDSAIAANGILTFDCDGVATGTAPKGLKVFIEYCYA